jgi:hypothetical protein
LASMELENEVSSMAESGMITSEFPVKISAFQ